MPETHKDAPARPHCAALEAEAARLREELAEAREQQMTWGELVARNRERARHIGERDDARALLRELAARLPDLLSPHGICQLCGAEGGHQPDCLLRRVDAEAGDVNDAM